MIKIHLRLIKLGFVKISSRSRFFIRNPDIKILELTHPRGTLSSLVHLARIKETIITTIIIINARSRRKDYCIVYQDNKQQQQQQQ